MIARPYPSFSQAQIFPSNSQASNSFVTFYFGADLPPFTVEVIPGRRITAPAIPPRTGFNFDGWFLDKTFSLLWSFDNIVGGDNITLYGKWTAIIYQVTYFLNGGVNNPANPASFTVEDADIALHSPSRDDDEFVAWYEDAMFSQHSINVINTQKARNINLYARFITRHELVFEAPPTVVKNHFEGDPKLYLAPNGADMRYEAGQPVMERGLENQIFISLFTKNGWCGNVFLPLENHVGSDFEETCAGSITLSKLADIENAAERALASRAFPLVDTRVKNPVSDQLKIEIILRSGGALSLIREGLLWRNQKERT